ncbi:MAG: hypothetical protein ACFB4I_02135 [Cyanophyceae cyanobacterium]
MTSSLLSSNEASVWESLKQAIAQSSGFQRWQQNNAAQIQQTSLDAQVRLYLQETLKTLAY